MNGFNKLFNYRNMLSYNGSSIDLSYEPLQWLGGVPDPKRLKYGLKLSQRNTLDDPRCPQTILSPYLSLGPVVWILKGILYPSVTYLSVIFA